MGPSINGSVVELVINCTARLDTVDEVKKGAWEGTIRPFAAFVLLYLIFLGLAATVDLDALKSKFTEVRERKGLVTGICCQFILIPFLAFCSVSLLELEGARSVTALTGFLCR